MNFSSITFLFYFLPLVIGLYFVVKRRAYRNFVLLVFSLIFYAWGEGYFILLLLGSIGFNHVISHQIQSRLESKSVWLSIGIIGNLGLLGSFKYLGFLTSELNKFGVEAIQLHLPLGISFFTFQAMSLLVDVYRGTNAPKSLLKTGLYISMFPQLIAGPIVRFNHIDRQIDQRSETFDKFADGIRIFVLGLAQKVLIADTLAIPVDLGFSEPASALTSWAAWLVIICFSFQIYFDFAGYSNMAIGLGRMLGFELPKNFNYPYQASSVREFWRRWHMTLSQWFRDYLYIPLGGSKLGPLKTYRNLLIVFVLCGLWHGAAWTFIFWGLWHGAFLVLERLFLSNSNWLNPGRILGQIYVFLAVTFGWVLFRSPDLSYAISFWKNLIGLASGDVSHYQLGFVPSVWLALTFAVLLSSEYWERNFVRKMTHKVGPNGAILVLSKWCLVTLLCALSYFVVAANTHQPFLYFRF